MVVGGASTTGGLGRALKVEGLGWKTPSEGSAAPLEVVEDGPCGRGVSGERGGMTTGGEMEEEEGRGRGVVEGREVEVGDVRWREMQSTHSENISIVAVINVSPSHVSVKKYIPTETSEC